MNSKQHSTVRVLYSYIYSLVPVLSVREPAAAIQPPSLRRSLRKESPFHYIGKLFARNHIRNFQESIAADVQVFSCQFIYIFKNSNFKIWHSSSSLLEFLGWIPGHSIIFPVDSFFQSSQITFLFLLLGYRETAMLGSLLWHIHYFNVVIFHFLVVAMFSFFMVVTSSYTGSSRFC
jgi:hypothetical protein